jgi:dihydrofolate synthase/folylpolyglutamate synthase
MKRTLNAWLAWQTQLHPNLIDLGLERCADVAERMGLLTTNCLVISVAGTNGKGSSVNLLDTIYRAAGYRVGRFTSPHVLKYNERIVINGVMVDDAALCRAFFAINAAREEVSLTFFEFGTLAALYLFQQADLDVWILEVGLGGRLDSVNIKSCRHPLKYSKISEKLKMGVLSFSFF